tara:strand:- start:241 stop:735 length:495 start_codon:yes stop_codon:yes gene_type:complete
MKILVKNNYLVTKSESFKCAIGLGGLTTNKFEGDHCTPVGEFKFEKIYYRSDKLGKINFQISSAEISYNDGWCDDPNDEFYNKFVKFPFERSAEKLYRTDDLYDIICVMNYNTDPVLPGKGSAIFLHVCGDNFAPTEGCIAVEKKVLIEISKQITNETSIIIEG